MAWIRQRLTTTGRIAWQRNGYRHALVEVADEAEALKQFWAETAPQSAWKAEGIEHIARQALAAPAAPPETEKE